MRTNNYHNRLRPLGVLVAFLAMILLSAGAYAADKYTWKPPQKGASYSATFKDSAGNQVMGEFNSEVEWELDKKGKVDINEWDKNAKFRYRGDDGEWHYVKNEDVKKGIISLNPDLTGTLSGNVKDYPVEAHPGEKGMFK